MFCRLSFVVGLVKTAFDQFLFLVQLKHNIFSAEIQLSRESDAVKTTVDP